MSIPVARGRVFTLAAVLVLITLAGCDTATTDTIVLGDVRVEFEFEFDGGSLVTGQLQSISSEGSSNIGPQLSSLGGFTLAEIVSGEVTEAEIDLFEPPFTNLSGFNQMILQLRSGSTVIEVASRTGFTAEEPASLTIVSSRDIRSLLAGGNFDAVLQVDPATLDADETYRLAVELGLSVEVEGV